MSEGRRGDLVLFCAALALRLAWAADLARLPLFDLPTGDSLFYAQQAARIVSGSTIGTELSYPSSPLYPYLIAPFFALPVRPAFAALYAAQAALDAASAVLLRRIASALFGAAAGWIAGIAWTGYGLAVFFASDAVEATAACFFANLFLLLLLLPALSGAPAANAPPGGEGRRAHLLAPRAALAGAALAAAALLRPHFLPILPLAAALLPWLRPRWQVGRALLSFILGAAGPLGLSLARNVAVSGEPVIVSPYSGLNAYLGNRRGASGYLTFPSGLGLRNDMDLKEAARLYPEAIARRGLSEGEVSRFWWRQTGQEILADPAAWTSLAARKILLFWSSYEAPNHLDFYFFREASAVLALAAIPFGLIAPLALVGAALVFTGRQRAPPPLALTLLTFAYAAVCALFFIADRFRLPVTGWIVVLAAGALGWILRSVSNRQFGRAALAGALALALGLALRTPPPPRHGAREHVMVASALAGRGRTAEAERLMRRAVEIDPGSAVARFNLGRLLAASGRDAEAEAETKEAVRLAPDFAAAHAVLGDLASRSGRVGEARESYERALQLEPYGPEADRIRRLLAAGNPADPRAAR